MPPRHLRDVVNHPAVGRATHKTRALTAGPYPVLLALAYAPGQKVRSPLIIMSQSLTPFNILSIPSRFGEALIRKKLPFRRLGKLEAILDCILKKAIEPPRRR